MPRRVMQIIDRLNVGGPTKYVAWLATGLDPREFETILVTGTIPPGEGDMSWFVADAGVEPVIIPEMSRELSLQDLLVFWKLLLLMLRYQPDLVHTHKAKAGAVGRLA
ncbi:MAG: glycosyltransferase, partial [Acidobacteriota bacterium]